MRKEQPGTILVDTNARYLYYVLPEGKAVRYGVTVGEEALAWSGVATVGRTAEWPDWIPTAEIQARLGPYPKRIPGGPASAGRASALPLRGQQGHPVPHPRHQPAGIYRPSHLVRLHPHDQRGHHRSRESGEARRDRRRPPARLECMDGAYRWFP
jgi:lipoprotein-anchoring transpeptidase ErfK/SrfK